MSWIALRGQVLPSALGWSGVVTGCFGLASTVPVLHDGAIVFGLLQIVWFTWVGLVPLARRPTTARVADPQRALDAG